MNSQIIGLRVGGTVFGIMCIGQLLRLLTRAEILIAGYLLPLWVSAVAVVITGLLSLWMWKVSCRASK